MFNRNQARSRRHQRIRRKVAGTAARPRLAVFRSDLHIVAQVIDDAAGRTLAHAASVEKAFREMKAGGKRRIEMAEAVGKALAQRCLEKGIRQVAFDRGGYRFHGRVAALAKGAREGGLLF